MKCVRQLYGSATVNEKGQIVIPADARRELGITPDMKLMIMGDPNKKVLVLVPQELFEKRAQSLIGKFFGFGQEADQTNS